MAYFRRELPDTPQIWLQGIEGTVRKVKRVVAWWNVDVDWDNGMQTSLDHESHELVPYHRPSRYEVIGDT